ncbi:nucleotidyltransferase domain-containing protein [Patescibacteria group bacterium]|nr:nucleotidyltransferase domain-containing protein [Patescibacteria group bacterium]MBU4162477.1 nucleotidyltransferase domain-containing protein [Patescibacteria group bacterium]
MLKLGSEITIKLLDYYFLNPKKEHHINQLADVLKIDPGNLFRKLKELENEGVLVSEKEGNQRRFKLNKDYPFLAEFKKIYESKYGFLSLLKEKISKLKNLQEAYVFGSYANSQFGPESDIDILLIGNHSPISAKRIILPLQSRTKREINIIDLTPDDFVKRKNKKDELIENIFSGQVIKIF